MKAYITIVLAAFLTLAAFSGFLVLTEDNSKVKTSEYSGTQLDEIAFNEGSFKKFSGIPGDNIIQKIEIQDNSLEFQEHWDGLETVTVDVQEFEHAASNGAVNLRLLERDFEIEIEEISRLNGGKSYRYSGYIKGIPQSKATFYVCGELFSGSIEFEDLMYNIAVTSEKYNGKTVHTVFIIDWKKDRERLKRSFNPLRLIFVAGSTGNSSEIEKCMAGEYGVFEEIESGRDFFEIPEACEDFEIVIANPRRFRESASNGTVDLSLIGKHFELKLKETNTSSSQITYAGYIIGMPQSSAVFAVGNDTIDGFINVDFYTLSYGIIATDKKCDGKVVHLICRYYNEDAEEELDQEFSADPLQFFLKSDDQKTHDISIKILDFYNESIFYKTYSLNPGNEISSPEISVEPGIYRYEITLDSNFTFEQEVRADYATDSGSSEKLHIDLVDHPEYPIVIGIEST
ncbi:MULTISPECIES: hypothetical protein [unclassified Methanosarcina]|uniref:hypothetical protein n=1 Tax=unclassified Methanosarcina TaxID=2644672 RepID=UPI000615AFB9|nr:MULTISPECIES: hypothetical protein [unclassified Methanosarcina]AKB16930.1 hypothetical protein MSWHS_0067 [Methanosarcina sp. WWM596]AKB20335.1 hypothetical protein MSWH1_0064 [Methanosarcina sp. WH1]